MSEYDVVHVSSRPITEASLVSDLREIGVQTGSILLVHSSLSALGWVCGGAHAVVRALQCAVGEAGTLAMPSQSAGLSDPSNWAAPAVPEGWWQAIRDTMPAYDQRITPTRGMGAIAELFRRVPGTLRSSHPSQSFAARGPRAAELVAEHQLEDGLGERSPLGALYALDASVLMLGVAFDSCTSIHLAERRAFGDAQPTIATGAPMLVDGVRQWVVFREPDVCSDDFADLGAEFDNLPGAVSSGRVGIATARLFRLRSLVDFAVPWLERNRP